MNPAGRPSILVVDDDADICRNMADILGDLGYRVETARDGREALERVTRAHFDVALLDLRMPGMDGLALYREIKKVRAGTVAMIVTAYASGTTAEEALAAGAWRVVPKPVDFPELLRLVGEAVEQPLVLVVDDDQDLCGNLWDLLRDGGYRVAIAHDAREAAEQVGASDFRVVLIDMKLPGADGARVFRLVREANPAARTVLITGYRSEMDALVGRVLSEGADAVCYKPFDMPQLLRALEDLARRGPGPDAGAGRRDG
jgi:CheY-like chemotaxis protein